MAEFRRETERLILRDWREDDWREFWEGTNRPAVMRWLGGVLDEAGRHEQRGRLMRYQREFGHTFWALERREDGMRLGFCGLKRCDQKGGPVGALEIGWRLRESAWGKGYAREAARATLELAFNELGSEEVVALTVRGNEASWGLMGRLGMQRREDLDFEDASWDVDDPVLIVYSISRKEWEAAQ